MHTSSPTRFTNTSKWDGPIVDVFSVFPASTSRQNTPSQFILFISNLFHCQFWWDASICIFGLTINRLGIPDLGIDEKYQRILQNYGRDIEMVSRIYMKQKLDPPIGRDLPPVAGRIMWARQLSSRIQGPMDLFQQVMLNFCLSAMKHGWA